MSDEYVEKLQAELETFNNDVLISISTLCCEIVKLRREKENLKRVVNQLKEEMKK